MKPAAGVSLLALLLAFFCGGCDATCVLESDFGVVINCAFKKSSLFRVRNLGGVKAHISWGLTIGDELGLKESISNSEMNRRRAAPASKAQVQLIEAQQEADKKKALIVEAPGNDTKLHEVVTTKTPQHGTVPPLPTVKSIFSTSRPRETSSESSRENEISYHQRPRSKPRSDHNSSQEYPAATNSTLLNIFQYIRNRFREAMTPPTTVPSSTKKKPTRAPSSAKTRKPKPIAPKIGVAPKEYHPVGYARNITTTTRSSRLKLPKTSFLCKEQKYFPGLYADQELGCSVFHVCAVLDSGELVARSFLCPESTLFDQATLRCNWWFYVDCAASKGQYEINMPVAKSYQLMRALATSSPSPEASEGGAGTTLRSKQNV